MLKSIEILKGGLESSSYKTPEFLAFSKTFKTELKKELHAVGAKLTDFSVGHFYVSGFFTADEKCFYFSLTDVRGMEFQSEINLLYRTAKDNKDFQGGHNQYVRLQKGMASKMNLR